MKNKTNQQKNQIYIFGILKFKKKNVVRGDGNQWITAKASIILEDTEIEEEEAYRIPNKHDQKNHHHSWLQSNCQEYIPQRI